MIMKLWILFLFAYKQAANSIEPIHKSVTLMDGRTVNVELESASTSAEVCKDVAAKIGLKDTYGFSLYISFQDKVIFDIKIY